MQGGIRFNDKEAGRLIAERAGTCFNPAVDVAISNHSSTGKLRGGTIYSGFTGSSISMHVGSDGSGAWMTPDFLWVAFHYPFVQLGCAVITAHVPSWNDQALAFDKKIGFEQLAAIEDGVPGGDLIILTMRRENCRWLRLRPRALTGGGPHG